MIQCHNQSILDLVTKEFFDPLVFSRHVLHCTEMVCLPMLAVALDPSSTVSGGVDEANSLWCKTIYSDLTLNVVQKKWHDKEINI